MHCLLQSIFKSAVGTAVKIQMPSSWLSISHRHLKMSRPYSSDDRQLPFVSAAAPTRALTYNRISVTPTTKQCLTVQWTFAQLFFCFKNFRYFTNVLGTIFIQGRLAVLLHTRVQHRLFYCLSLLLSQIISIPINTVFSR